MNNIQSMSNRSFRIKYSTPEQWAGAEQTLIRWSNLCKYRIHTHDIDALYFSRADRYVTATHLTVAALSGVTNMSLAHNSLAVYISGGIFLANTILSGITKAFGFSEESVRHANAADKYSYIVMDIDGLLAIPAADRAITPDDALKTTKNAVLQIQSQAPVIPDAYDGNDPPPNANLKRQSGDYSNIFNRSAAPLYSHRLAFWPVEEDPSISQVEMQQVGSTKI